MTTEYREMLEKTKKDLRKAKVARALALHNADKAETEIFSLRQVVAALSKLCGESFDDRDEFGLTDAIRMVLRSVNGNPMTPIDVRTKLQTLGYDVSGESMLPNIHTTLKRLALKGEVDDNMIKDGNKTAYRWIEERMRMTPPPEPEISYEEEGAPLEPELPSLGSNISGTIPARLPPNYVRDKK